MNISARTFTYVLTAFMALIGHNVASEPSLEVGRIPPLPPARALMERLPLFFEIPGDASRSFVARGPGYVVRLGPDEVSLDTPAAHGVAPTSLRMRLVGARVDAVGEPLEALPGKLHELRGSSPEQWRLGIASFARLRFSEVYPGVDVEYYGNRGRLEYDFRLAPGISPARIRLRFEGASDLKIDDEGALVMQVAGATVRQPPPYAYQEIGESRHPVEASFVIRDPMEVGFVVKGHNPSLPLVIDPIIIYSELLGGGGADTAYDVVTDHDGLVYMVGATESADFPIDNASQSESAGRRDVFVMKFDPGTGFLYYVTYLGGAADDIGYAVATDDAGNAYVVGSTRSADFPTLAPFQGSLRGSADAFITKLDFEGLPLFSTYLGGDALDIALDVAVDVAGRVHLVGTTRSSNFPTEQAFQGSLAGSADAFVATLSPLGTALDYATYMGGSGFDQGMALVLDGDGNRYLTGETSSSDFPSLGPWQPELGGGHDAFIAQLDVGGVLRFATYLGGSGLDRGQGIALGDEGRLYITGSTLSPDFPVLRPLQSMLAGGFDAFVTGLDLRNRRVLFSTFFGGQAHDFGFDVAADGASIYVVGQTGSSDLPGLLADELPRGGGMDSFLTRLDTWGSAPMHSTFLGGSGHDAAMAVALNPYGKVNIAGTTDSGDFLRRSFASPAGGTDAFLVGYDATQADLEVRIESSRGRGLDVVVSNRGPDAAQRVELVVAAPGLDIQPVPDQGTCWVTEGAAVCDLETIAPGEQMTVELPAKLGSGVAHVRAVTSDPEPLDNTIPLDALWGRRMFLRVKLAGKGAGRVISVPSGIHCGNDCLERYGRSTDVVLVAEPDPGSRFAGWRGGCRGTGECSVNVDSPTTVIALFKPVANNSRGKKPKAGTTPPNQKGQSKKGGVR